MWKYLYNSGHILKIHLIFSSVTQTIGHSGKSKLYNPGWYVHTHTHAQVWILTGLRHVLVLTVPVLFPHIYIVTLWIEVHEYLSNTQIKTLTKIEKVESILLLKDTVLTWLSSQSM